MKPSELELLQRATNKTAKPLFYEKRYNEAFEIFKNSEMPYEAGLCKLLTGDVELARIIWQSSETSCIATDWGLIVLDLIKLKSTKTPCYFQIRGFLEVYLNLFMENGFIEYAENLISAYEIFSRVNFESCKFIARALFAHEYYELALEFIEKSREICYPDPEGLLIEAQCFYTLGNNEKSLKSLEELLNILPEYVPALELKQQLV